jgi:hypothetical protein
MSIATAATVSDVYTRDESLEREYKSGESGAARSTRVYKQKKGNCHRELQGEGGMTTTTTRRYKMEKRNEMTGIYLYVPPRSVVLSLGRPLFSPVSASS